MSPTPVGQFEYDAMNDKLPTVSWILPPSDFDEHPAHLPAAGATFVASEIDAVAANPDVWAKTVFILSYDENDGMFDHVVPPTPPDGTADEFVTTTSVTGVAGGGLPVGLGFRVPAIVVSPWTVGGWVCSCSPGGPRRHASTGGAVVRTYRTGGPFVRSLIPRRARSGSSCTAARPVPGPAPRRGCRAPRSRAGAGRCSS
jgi:hypothetical protein